MTFCRDEQVWIPESDLEGMSVDTLAVRAGQIRTGQLEHSDPIFPTSSFVYGSAAQAAARFGGEEPGLFPVHQSDSAGLRGADCGHGRW